MKIDLAIEAPVTHSVTMNPLSNKIQFFWAVNKAIEPFLPVDFPKGSLTIHRSVEHGLILIKGMHSSVQADFHNGLADHGIPGYHIHFRGSWVVISFHDPVIAGAKAIADALDGEAIFDQK